MKKLVIDCGGTKIESAELVNGELCNINKIAFNGNIIQNEKNLKSQLLKLVNNDYDSILIGIAGYRAFNKKENFTMEFPSNCRFISDIDLASTALLKNNKGLVAVIGTGSVLAHQTSELSVIGGYGHVLGDYGSGYHFGKVLFLEYMKLVEINHKNNFTRMIEEHFNCEGRTVLSTIINNEKQQLSKLSEKFMDHPETSKVFEIYFNEFLKYISYYQVNLNEKKIIISGSITNSKRFIENASKHDFIELKNVKNIEAIKYWI